MNPSPVLVLNAGSSTLKAALLPSPTTERLWQGQQSWSDHNAAGHNPPDPQALAAGLEAWLPAALDPWQGQLELVAHRLVHGGSRFSEPLTLDAAAREELAAVSDLAPLHNGTALAVIDWIETWLQTWQPGLRQWACFDTAFHSTLPASASTYALPAAWRAKGLRRYGFHGLNHQHVAETVAAILHDEGRSEQELAQLRLISAHLGAGCSLCAVQGGGRSIA
ncbi:MAG: acetate kinase, partial [Cyanobacteria bacterium K_DeepCast_35m_m2_023]|nr:acetate kinase [Cyanobacteria bacterium K_DeepCast_35m_m2_023]